MFLSLTPTLLAAYLPRSCRSCTFRDAPAGRGGCHFETFSHRRTHLLSRQADSFFHIRLLLVFHRRALVCVSVDSRARVCYPTSVHQEENKHDLPGVSRGFGVIKFLRHRDVLGWWIVHRPSFLNQHCCQFPASPSGRLIFAASPGSAFQAQFRKGVPLALPLAAFIICALLFTFFFGGVLLFNTYLFVSPRC